MRIVKEHEERSNEILDTAQRLFSKMGYEKCTVNDILNEIGIAKGTFYHYFKSKAEVLDAITERATELIEERATEVAENTALTPEEKLLHIFLSMQIKEEVGENLLEEIHKPENALMHQKSLAYAIRVLTPILVGVVEEGIEQGVFTTAYPEQNMQIFLAASITLLDGGIFEMAQEKQQMMFRALVAMLAGMLGVEEKAFWEKASAYWNG